MGAARTHRARRSGWRWWYAASWAAIVLTLVCAPLWYLSGLYHVRMRHDNGLGGVLVNGIVHIYRDAPKWGGIEVYDRDPMYPRYLWLEARARYDRGWFGVTLPIWTIAAASLITATITRRLALRPARAERCAKCGYARAGLSPETPCPECGATDIRGADPTAAD